MVEKKANNGFIRLVKGFILDMEVDAVVYDIKEDLVLGAGIGGAISVRGGPSVQEELNKLEKIKVGEAVITGAGLMPLKYIIHTVGPKFQEDDTTPKLRSATLNALKKAEEKEEIRKLAFPPLGTGLYGVPLPLCAEVMLTTVQEYLNQNTRLEAVVFCLFDNREFKPFQTQVEAM